MAEVGARTVTAGWLLLGIAVVALDGCFERHEPANPFIGPFGASEESSFAARPPAAPGQDQARAARPAPAPAELLLVELRWGDLPWVELPRWAQADADPAGHASSQP
jgi:hypothetical protein